MPMSTVVEGRGGTLVREHPFMRWGAVFAGWFVASGTATVLYAFGLAVGLSAFNPQNAAAVSRGISAGVMVWVILTWGASLWVGAMFASWFDGGNDTEMGVVRGLTVWGLSVAATGLLVVSGLTHVGFVISMPQTATPTVDPAQLAHYTARMMWAAFGASALALFTAAVGGWVGARQVHHVYHLREYPPHDRVK